MGAFTKKELKIMTKLNECHCLYLELEKQHPSDLPDWINSFHDLQKVMAIRILRREHPELFATYK